MTVKKPAAVKKQSTKNKPTIDTVEKIRQIYVQGVEGIQGKRVHPTLQTLADDFNVNIRTIESRCSKDGWVKQREVFEAKLQEEVDTKKRKDIVKQVIDFDARSLNLASAILGQAGRIIRNAEMRREAAQSERTIVNRRGVEETIPADPTMDPLSPTALTMLSNAVSASQKVGRLALGEYTEHTNVTDDRAADDELASAIADLFGMEGSTEKNLRKPH